MKFQLDVWRGTLLRTAIAALIIVAWIGPLVRTAPAADLAEQATSLKIVPKDAAFYSASLKFSEQLNIVLESNAYAKLLEIPLVQFAKGQIEFQWQQASLPGVKEFRAYVDSPEGQDAVAVLKEMFADEIFLYGGNDVTELLQLFMGLNDLQRNVRQEATASGEEFDDLLAKRLLEAAEEHSDEYAVPTVVIGFRIKDKDRAEEQLDVIHGHLRNALEEDQPEIASQVKREEIAGHEFLTLRLDGSMIPWDKVREEADDVNPEQFEKWRALISKKTLAVALGVIDDYVLLSLGESTEHLDNLGDGETLAEHEAIKRLEKHAGERIVSLTFVSQAVAKDFSSPEKTVNDLASGLDDALRQMEITDEQREKLLDDIRDLNFAKYMPSPGDMSSVVFLTERGYESFQYHTGKNSLMDSSKPLTILSHVGGNPLMFFASRSKDSVEDYDAAIDWLKRTALHVEEIAESKAKPEDWAEYTKYRDQGIALLSRLDKANREFLYPAFADNQGAIVINAEAISDRWTKHMPRSPKPLPMLDIALVSSVSDADSLRKGVKEYCSVLRDGIELAREIDPDDVPEFEIPKPEQRDADDGDLYVYSLPEEWGIDEQIAPTAGLTDAAATISAMPATAEELLKETPVDIDTSIDLDRPAAKVVHVKIAKMLEVARPWIDYGLAVATGTLKKERDEDDADGEDAEDDSDDEEEAEQPNPMLFQLGFVMPQLYQFLDVAAVVRSATSITYEEDGVWVTHSETHIEDLKD